MYNEYLAHYGVLGMRWGVRKDQKTSFRNKKHKLKNNKSDSKKETAKRIIKKLVMLNSSNVLTNHILQTQMNVLNQMQFDAATMNHINNFMNSMNNLTF